MHEVFLLSVESDGLAARGPARQVDKILAALAQRGRAAAAGTREAAATGAGVGSLQ